MIHSQISNEILCPYSSKSMLYLKTNISASVISLSFVFKSKQKAE